MENSEFFTMVDGNLFVMMDGAEKRALLLVGSWVSIIMSPIVIAKQITMVIGLIMWFVLEMKKR